MFSNSFLTYSFSNVYLFPYFCFVLDIFWSYSYLIPCDSLVSLSKVDLSKDYEAKLLDMKTKCNDKLRESDQKAFQTESQLNKIKAD
jgi:hypothetical protein